jgi:hypothetical protein
MYVFYSPLSPPVSEPLTNRGVLLSTLLQDILHPSHHLLNVLLQIANKLGLSNKQTKNTLESGTRRSIVVKTLRYKPEGRGFETRWGDLFQFT